MKQVSITSNFIELDFEELTLDFQNLVSQAKEAICRAYAPYSNFPVGAAVLLQNKEVVLGSNQENAAYPSGLCAERTALFYTSSHFLNQKIRAIAVAVKNSIKDYPSPCGSCLQVISEYEERQESPIEVLLVHPENGKILLSKGIKNLLPLAFKKTHLTR